MQVKWTKREEPMFKYQLVGDNWDKEILPSYRTTERKTQSLHLFQVYAIVDRYIPRNPQGSDGFQDNLTYIPSLPEQKQLLKELKFIFASAIIRNVPEVAKCFNKIYPKHLEHEHSHCAGIKTTQVQVLYNEEACHFYLYGVIDHELSMDYVSNCSILLDFLTPTRIKLMKLFVS
jgi:hypothetical protein